MGLGAVYPFFTDPDGVSVWFGLKPHAHERVVWIFAIKVTVWFHCVEWGNSVKPSDTRVDVRILAEIPLVDPKFSVKGESV